MDKDTRVKLAYSTGLNIYALGMVERALLRLNPDTDISEISPETVSEFANAIGVGGMTSAPATDAEVADGLATALSEMDLE